MKSAHTKGIRKARLAVVLLSILTACNYHNYTTPTPVSFFEPLPVFILEAQPAPMSEISLDWYGTDIMSDYILDSYEGGRPVDKVGYRSNVCILLDIRLLLQAGDQLVTYQQVIERTSLSINGIKITPELDPYYTHPETLYLYPKLGPDTKAGAPYWLCWPIELNVGMHQVSFLFQQTDGKHPVYTWQFKISP
jgi:hypothetical protein